ncbi:MAG: hypothetical protein ACRDBM_00070 [Sporomusa sp.]
MLASYDKIIKYLVEKFQTSLAPLDSIARNQEIVVSQNKQIIDLLLRMSNCREPGTIEQDSSPTGEVAPDENAPTES